MTMKRYTVWISNAKSLDEICDPGNDLLRYDGKTREEAMQLLNASLNQGFLVILDEELEPDPEQEG